MTAKLMPGSPPHTWRIQVISLLVVLMLRITSTYVENTVKMKPNTRILEDHLHIRGEYLIPTPRQTLNQGSPPHTWRILSRTTARIGVFRITSTYVENTRSRLFHRCILRDHLHIRGEYQLVLVCLTF